VAFWAGGDGDGNPLDGRIRQEVAARMIFGPRGGRLRAKDAALTFRQWCSSGTLARDCSEFEL